MAERFYSPPIGPDDTVVLTGDEANHLARVRRIRRGERVLVFDGSGIECDAVVREIGRNEVVLSIEARQPVDRELPFSLTLGCSPAKGDRLHWLIEKATELGVSRFVPILTERSSEQARGLRPEKAERWVIEACKQCGRNILMEVSDAVAWPDFLASSNSQSVRLIAAPTGSSLNVLDGFQRQTGIVIAVGPEGGFTPGELDTAVGVGWEPISLGPRTLRVETAALAMVASVTARLRAHCSADRQS
jgi:16S rRNA (uracil1498-N3)-methyltransferase